MFLKIQVLYFKASLDSDLFLQSLVIQVYTAHSNIFHSDKPIINYAESMVPIFNPFV